MRLRKLLPPIARISLISRLFFGVSLIPLLFPATVHSNSAHPYFQAEKPFGLPFADPPGPSTWLFGQPYGNTVFAYRTQIGRAHV